MVSEWFLATQETKQVRTASGQTECAKTALMVAPTWTEIDQLNIIARHRLRTNGQLTGEDKKFVALRAKDWTAPSRRTFATTGRVMCWSAQGHQTFCP